MENTQLKLRRVSKDRAAAWAMKMIKQDIIAKTTDDALSDLVGKYERIANRQGYTLDDAGIYDTMITYRLKQRYGKGYGRV